ncbi:MAG: hypothetical protein JNM56_07790 [Planctomycetia bacterium]|nr:hypothetical protein [Planctomycetia bacterium]
MTEKEWLACEELLPMLYHLRGPGEGTNAASTSYHSPRYGRFILHAGPSTHVSSRKCQLFAAACIRRYGYLTHDVDCFAVATAFEHFADRLMDPKELQDAYLARCQIMMQEAATRSSQAASFAHFLMTPIDAQGAGGKATSAAWMLAWARAGESVKQTCPDADEEDHFAWSFFGGPPDAYWQETLRNEVREQSELLRHIIGNPFRSYPAAASWPALLVDLARQLYDGGEVRLILHDALEDAGRADLAEHFRVEDWHPKGCWVLDSLLGKT